MKTSIRIRGFTLIEVMVAMALSIIVLIGVSQIYTTNRQNKRIQEMQNQISQDGHYAMTILRRLTYQAGYSQMPTANVTSVSNPWITAGGGTIFNAVTTAGSANATNGVSVTSRFVGGSATDTSVVNCLGTTVTDSAMHTAQIYFDSASQSLKCWFDRASGGSAVNLIAPSTDGRGTEVVDFKLQYGIDATSYDTNAAVRADFECGLIRDCIADTYNPSQMSGVLDTATLTTELTNNQIVSLRACLVLRTETSDPGIVRATGENYQDCSGTNIVQSASDNKIYRTFNTTIQVRNRLWD